MSVNDMISDIIHDIRETTNKYPNCNIDYNSIPQKIPCSHMDSRTGAEIRFDLKLLGTRRFTKLMKEVLVDIMDNWHYNRRKVNAIVLIAHHGRGRKMCANSFDLYIKSAINKSQFNHAIYAYKSKLGDGAIHLLKFPLDYWEVKSDFDFMWKIDSWNERNGGNSLGVAP